MSGSLERRIMALERQVERLTRRDGTPHALARTLMAADDSGPVQTVQAQLDAVSIGDAIPIMYHHGFFASPPIGADLQIAYIDGDRSKAVVVASNHQSSRKKGAAAGDAGLYAHGHLFHMNSAGILVTGNIAQTGNQTITGDLHVTGAVIAGFGGGDQVGLQTHLGHSGSAPPTPGT